MTDGVTTALVEAQTESPPPGMGLKMFRCVYCNCHFVTDHAEGCECKIEVCPNADCPGHEVEEETDE